MSVKQWECEYKPPSNYDRGHWRIYQNGITKEGFRHLIATTAPDREEKAHAHLIASAPSLLTELDCLRAQNAELLAVLQDMVSSYQPAPKSPGALWLTRARAAIARATGSAS